MDIAFYYTFSTIPQVLAGAIALFGVFVLYKIQHLKSQLIGYGNSILIESTRDSKEEKLKLKKNTVCNIRLEKAIARNDIADIKVHIDILAYLIDEGSDMAVKRNYEASFTRIKDNFEKTNKKKSILINSSLFCMILTCIIIIGSILIIPFGSKIILKQGSFANFNIYIIGIIAMVICLFFIVLIISISIKEKNQVLSKKVIKDLKKRLEASKGKIIKDYIFHKKEGIITLLYDNKPAYSKEPVLIKIELEELQSKNNN